MSGKSAACFTTCRGLPVLLSRRVHNVDARNCTASGHWFAGKRKKEEEEEEEEEEHENGGREAQ